jgi:DNA-binding transcriptional LysR family regulator
MEFQEARTLALLASQGSIKRVAETFHVSSPTVHKRLKKLEEEFGVQLYERAGGRLKPTQAAETILPHLQEIVAEYDLATRGLQEWTGIKKGALRIGAGPIVSAYFVPNVLDQFLSRHPGVTALIRTLPFAALVELLQNGAIDIALLHVIPRPYKKERFPPDSFKVIFELEMALISGVPWPVRRWQFADFAAEPFILYGEDSRINIVMEQYFDEIRFSPRVAVRCDSTEGIKKMVQQGLGMSLLPLCAVETEVQNGTLHRIVQREHVLSLKIGLATRKNSYTSPSVRALIELIQELAGPNRPSGSSKR